MKKLLILIFLFPALCFAEITYIKISDTEFKKINTGLNTETIYTIKSLDTAVALSDSYIVSLQVEIDRSTELLNNELRVKDDLLDERRQADVMGMKKEAVVETEK